MAELADDPSALDRVTLIREPRKRRLFEALVKRDGGALCQHCGCAEHLTLDHVDPDGPTVLDNLQILCRSCNSSKGSTTEDKTVRWANSLWQAGFTMMPNRVLLEMPLSAVALRVYMLFLHFARLPDSEWPGQDGLRELAQCSERTLRDAIRELENVRLIKTRRRGLGKTNVYILLAPRPASNDLSASAESADQEDAISAAPSTSLKKEPKKNPLTPVEQAWITHSPPLIEHRAAYFSDEKVKRKVVTAVKRYGADDVAAAVSAYAEVLASPAHYWTHRWTLGDFLTRGLDKFVPEADPLKNFASDRNGKGPPGGAMALRNVEDFSVYNR